ncbi:MAG TPA: hypothetical protein VHY57_06735, partial [Rhizomicrobium sp.]|nr:hypothetical protein [Rhizomicrobium sp.]
MKFSAIAAIMAAAAFAGAAVAQDTAPQATMQPVPNPPESAGSSHHGMHHKMSKHHMSAKHHKSSKAKSDTEATPAP